MISHKEWENSVTANNFEKIQKLFHVATVNQKWELMQRSIERNLVSIVSFLAINMKLNNRSSPIDMVLKSSHQSLEILKILVQNGASLSHQEIYFIIHNKKFEMIQFLYEANLLNEKPYHWIGAAASSANGDLQIVKFFESKFKFVTVEEWLEASIVGNQFHMFQYFMEQASPPFPQSWACIACGLGNFEIFKTLFEKGNVIINPSNFITFATEGENLNILKYLFEQGANLNQIDSEGRTPLYVVSRNGNLENVRWFVENGANVNLENHTADRETALWAAINFGWVEIVKYLISKGSKVTNSIFEGENHFRDPIRSSSVEIVKILVENGGLDFRYIDKNGETNLYRAVNHEREETVKFLIEKGADVNARNTNDERKTPLFAAVKSEKLNIVKKLIENGADFEIENFGVGSILEAMIIRNNIEIVKYFFDLKKLDVKRISKLMEIAIRNNSAFSLKSIMRFGFDNLKNLMIAKQHCIENFDVKPAILKVLNDFLEEAKKTNFEKK